LDSSNSHWHNLFNPESVAVIGASNSPGTWGFNIFWRVLNSGDRRVYPVNPSASEIMGVKTFARISDISEPVDLAVIVVKASRVPDTLQECIQKGVKAAEVISAGFAETGVSGTELEAKMVAIARQGGIRFIGPNTMGHADFSSNLSTLAWTPELTPGPVAFVAQSGNLGNRVLLNGINMSIGFSKFISTGNEADLHLEDYLEFLGQDKNTGIITSYIEGLRDGRRFFELAKAITPKKPVVVIKSGGTAQSARAARSHTGALAGSDEVYSAAFKQAGVMRVEDDDELCDVVISLLNQPLPRGNRVGILAIGGGLGVLATEACEREGLQVASLTEGTLEKLDAILPPRWPRANPVDMVGMNATADNSVILSSVLALLEDKNIDVVLLQAPLAFDAKFLINIFHFNDEQLKAFEETQENNLSVLKQKMAESGKPVLVVMPINDVDTNKYFLSRGFPAYPSPRRAARVVRQLVWYRSYLDSIGR